MFERVAPALLQPIRETSSMTGIGRMIPQHDERRVTMSTSFKRMIGTLPSLAVLAGAGLLMPAPAHAVRVPCEAAVRDYCLFFWERDGYAYYDDCVIRRTEATCPYPDVYGEGLALPEADRID